MLRSECSKETSSGLQRARDDVCPAATLFSAKSKFRPVLSDVRRLSAYIGYMPTIFWLVRHGKAAQDPLDYAIMAGAARHAKSVEQKLEEGGSITVCPNTSDNETAALLTMIGQGKVNGHLVELRCANRPLLIFFFFRTSFSSKLISTCLFSKVCETTSGSTQRASVSARPVFGPPRRCADHERTRTR